MQFRFLKTVFLCLALFLFAFVFPDTRVRAANSLDIATNEIAWMGTPLDGKTPQQAANDEWIELYNNTGSPIDLSGWRLVAAGGTPEINLSGTVPTNGFYLLERTDDTTVPNISADQIYTGALGNSGEHLQLFDNQGNLIDEVNSSGSWFAGDNNTKQTMERKNSQSSGNDISNWQTSQNPGGTPKAQNSIGVPPPTPSCQPTSEICDGIDNDCDGNIDEENVCQAPQSPSPSPSPTPATTPQSSPETQNYPSGIFINEFLPSPEGPDSEEEFIELYNSNSAGVDLSGWSIEDTQGSTKTYTFPNGTNAQGYGFFVLGRPTSKIVLNNEGEGLILKNPIRNVVASVSFTEEAPAGQSYARKTDGGWQWTSNLTPGQKNSFATFQETVQELKTESEPQAPEETMEESKELPQSGSQETPESQAHTSGIYLNEILPSPAGPDEDEEWIEIFNQNGFEVDLSGWQIKDTKGKIKTYVFPQNTKISPKGFLLFSRPTTKITLNNEGDGLILSNPAGEITNQVSFEKAPTGESYNRTASGWAWSETLTPGSENITATQSAKEAETEEKTGVSEKGLAAIGKLIPKFPRVLFAIFTALMIAIASGVVILILKKKIKKDVL